MAFINEQGKLISYECSDLIEDLKQDIKECGGNKVVAVWCKEYEGVIIYTNYNFIVEEQPILKSELKDGEFLKQMKMKELLILLEEQNKII